MLDTSKTSELFDERVLGQDAEQKSRHPQTNRKVEVRRQKMVLFLSERVNLF